MGGGGGVVEGALLLATRERVVPWGKVVLGLASSCLEVAAFA